MKTLTKKEIIETLHFQIKLPKNLLFQIVNTLLEEMKKTLELEEELKIVRFGIFIPQQSKRTKGRNLKTQQWIEIKPFKKVSFHLSPCFKKELYNSKR